MNSSAPLVNVAAPALSSDDELAIFTRAIDRIDGLGKNRRQPRRMPLNSRRWNVEAGSRTGNSTFSQDITNANGYNNSNNTTLDPSSSTLAEDMLVDFPSISPATTSPTSEPPFGDVVQGHSSSTRSAIGENIFRRLSSLRSLSTELVVERDGTPSPSSFVAPT